MTVMRAQIKNCTWVVLAVECIFEVQKVDEQWDAAKPSIDRHVLEICYLLGLADPGRSPNESVHGNSNSSSMPKLGRFAMGFVAVRSRGQHKSAARYSSITKRTRPVHDDLAWCGRLATIAEADHGKSNG